MAEASKREKKRERVKKRGTSPKVAEASEREKKRELKKADFHIKARMVDGGLLDGNRPCYRDESERVQYHIQQQEREKEI